MSIYFDNAATSSPKPKCVVDAVNRALTQFNANPGRSGHRAALEAGRTVQQTRERLQQLIGAEESSSVIFTFNCTDALNLAIKGVCRPGMRVVTTVWSHNSVLRPLKRLASEGKIQLRIASDVLEAIDKHTDLVVVPHANNVTGEIIPVEQVAVLCQMHKALLIVDAAQTAGILPLYPEEWGVDLCAMPGHKGLLGIQGTGALYIRPTLTLDTLKEGGTGTSSHLLTQPEERPERYESGTLNTPGIASLGQGARFALEHRAEIHGQELLLTDALLCGLLNIPHVKVYGALDAISRVGTLSFNVNGRSSSEVADALDRAGICVRAGLHCAPLAHEAMGTLDQGAVRASLGFATNIDDIRALLLAVERIAKGERL